MALASILCAIVAVLFVLHCFFDVHYFLRMILCLVMARFTKKKAHILDLTTFYSKKIQSFDCNKAFFPAGICLTNDIDTLITHMNNVSHQFN